MTTPSGTPTAAATADTSSSGGGTAGRSSSPLPLHKTGFKFRAEDFVRHQHSSQHQSGNGDRLPHASDADAAVTASTTLQEEEREDVEFFEMHYELLQFLGKGRRGNVFACRHRALGEVRAVKVWRKSRKHTKRTSVLHAGPLVDYGNDDFEDFDNDDEKVELTLTDVNLDSPTHKDAQGHHKKKHTNKELTEFYLMQELHHPNVAKIYELLEGPTHYYMIMEFVQGGSLRQDLKQQPGERYSEDKAALFMYQLLHTIAYLHSSSSSSTIDQVDVELDKTIEEEPAESTRTTSTTSQATSNTTMSARQGKNSMIHCDLNLHNILLDTDHKDKIPTIKLIDFGDAVVDYNVDDNDNDNNDMDDMVEWFEPRGAQLAFMAPEMIAFDAMFGKPADMWSLGVICYIMLSGKYPFGYHGMTSSLELQNDIELVLQPKQSQAQSAPRINEEQDEEEDVDDDINQHALFCNDLVWLDVSNQAKDFCRTLLQYHPDDRPTAEEALHHEWMEHTRQRAIQDKIGIAKQHLHWKEHAMEVWSGLKQTARRKRASAPQVVLKHAALTFIATQLVLKEEKAHIDEVFQLMDIGADGVLSKDEVKKAYQEIFGRELKESDLQALFDKVDLGGTGTIEYSEFVIAALNEKQLLHTDKLRQAFEAFDSDHTGFISAANLRPILQSYLAEHDEEEHVSILEQIIEQVDRDGDGQISLEEFMAMMLHSSSSTTGQQHHQQQRRRRRRNPNAASRNRRTNNNLSSSVTSSLTASMTTGEAPNVFASTTTSLSSSQRKELWTPSVQLRFRPEDVIGKRRELLTSAYDIGEYIQSGAFGSVWFCKHKASGAERAVKYVKKSKKRKENELILREFNILRSLDHPNILKMYELFEDGEHYEIVMDVCKGGDLCDEIDKYGAIAEIGVCLILHQVLTCVNYCHQRHIVHCDLKPDNILLEENKAINQIKVIDFGLAANLLGEEERKEGSVVGGRIKERRGTLRFMAPEVLDGDYGPKCDVWACGVMAYLLLSDRFPFEGKERETISANIRAGKYRFHDPIWKGISDDAKSFVKECLTMDEQKRPTAEEALLHPWLQMARDQVSANFHKKEVCTAAEVLHNVKHFEARSVLSQAVSTFIASQLLAKEEKAKIDEVFRVMDVSCDGKLSKHEVKAGYHRVFGCELSDDDVDKIFARADMAGTGYLEYSEFVVASLSQKELFSDDRLRKAFQVFDPKNRGYISANSLKRGLSSFVSDGDTLSDITIQRIMDEVDRDDDGRISYNDFVAAMLNSADIPVTQTAKKGGLMEGLFRIFDKK